MAGASSTMLNKCGESGHPCVVPDLRGNTLRFSQLRMMGASAIGALLHSGMFPLYSLWSFYHSMDVAFSQKAFLQNLKNHMIYSSFLT